MASSQVLIGHILGHYRIVEHIGAGGMGVVYRAHDEQLDRDVALKVLPTGTLANEVARQRFRREALALAKLNHQNVAAVYEFGSQDGIDFLVMELIRGVMLDIKLVGGALSEREVVRLGIQIAEGLAAAHEQRIVHRDLKPGNLRITPVGNLKILDFGLAQLIEPENQVASTTKLTLSQEVAGTLPYMTPEQLRGETTDARSDIWAVGVVLYEMATGRRPFDQKISTALADDIIHKPPLPPRQVRPELSVELEPIILKCLEKPQAKRYQSAQELRSDLERIITGAAPLAARPRWPWTALIASTVCCASRGNNVVVSDPKTGHAPQSSFHSDSALRSGAGIQEFIGQDRSGVALDCIIGDVEHGTCGGGEVTHDFRRGCRTYEERSFAIRCRQPGQRQPCSLTEESGH